jgi:ribosomal RNA-processing protein 9
MPPNYNRKKKSRDPFFEDDSTKRRKVAADEDLDAEIDSGSDEDGFFDSKDEPEHVEEVENADETRKRIAKEYLKKFQESARKEKALRDEDDDYEGSDEDDEGARDSLIAQRMIKEQQEESGRIRKAIASRFNFYKFDKFDALVIN